MPHMKECLPNVSDAPEGYAEWLAEKNEEDLGPIPGPNCPNCGSEPLDGDSYCPSCNYPLWSMR